MFGDGNYGCRPSNDQATNSSICRSLHGEEWSGIRANPRAVLHKDKWRPTPRTCDRRIEARDVGVPVSHHDIVLRAAEIAEH